MMTEWRVRFPGLWIREERSAVKEVSAKGSKEKSRRQTGGGAANSVLVDLRKAGAEVEKGRCPGEDAACNFGGRDRRRRLCGLCM